MKITDSYKGSSANYNLDITNEAFNITLLFNPEVIQKLG